ncbi:MAG TPA: hypothetical protein VFA44_04580 [Gaiellaceae bacterium]|nr:hypothetical protein [Gaiellaceae bacterium]
MTTAAAREGAAVLPRRTWFDRVYAAIPLATVLVALLALYAWETSGHTSPWLFTDELELSQISRAVEATGHGARRGEPYFWQTLYTWLIAPAWAIHSATLAYAVVKYIGTVTMTLSLVPTYLLARTIASPRGALFAAAATASVPALTYGPMILEEPLAYPYAALAFLLIALALVRRTRRWIAAAVVVSAVGGLVKGELGILPVVFVLAAGLYALSSDSGRRWRSGWSAWDWLGAVVVGAGLVILFSALVGKFSDSWAVATGHYRGRMLEYGLWAVGALTIGVGVLPVLAALAALARPRGEPRTPELRAFRSLFVAACLGFGMYTAVKAAYVSTTSFTRVEERNVIYLVPLLFCATALWLERPRLRLAPLAAAVGFVAYLIVSTPYQLTTVPAGDSFGVAIVQMANRNLGLAHGGIEKALIVVLVLSVALLAAPRLVRGRPGWSRGSLAAAAVLVLAWCLAGQISAAIYSNDAAQTLVRPPAYPRPLDWLDQATHGQGVVYLGQNFSAGGDLGLWLTEFWNRSLKKVWSIDPASPAPGPGPTLTPDLADPATGALSPDPGLPYAMVENGIDLNGTIVGRYGLNGRWVLYRIRPPLRYAHTQTGIFTDGQTGCSLLPCPAAHSAYNQFSTRGNRPGFVVVDVSRLSVCGAPLPPAGVTVVVGTLVKGADKQPHIGRVTRRREWTIRPGTAYRFVIPTPRPPFRVEVRIAPTYAPTSYGSSDQRQLGGQVGFRFTQVPAEEVLTACPAARG